MFDTVFGLPVHVLVAHAVVVLVPLAAVGIVVIAVVPRWRAPYGWPVLALATAGLAAAPVATRSGNRLQARIGDSPDIAAHEALGDLVPWLVLAMWVVAVALVVLDRSRTRSAAGDARLLTVLAVLAVLTSLTATAQVIRAGHSGSDAVWGPIVESTNPR